jgi:hypothetical protein
MMPFFTMTYSGMVVFTLHLNQCVCSEALYVKSGSPCPFQCLPDLPS